MQALLNAISAMYNALSSSLVAVLNWFLDLITVVINLFADISLESVKFLINLLPVAPAPPAMIINISGIANMLLPMSEMVASLSIIASVYAAVYLFKIIKLIRGG